MILLLAYYLIKYNSAAKKNKNNIVTRGNMLRGKKQNFVYTLITIIHIKISII